MVIAASPATRASQTMNWSSVLTAASSVPASAACSTASGVSSVGTAAAARYMRRRPPPVMASSDSNSTPGFDIFSRQSNSACVTTGSVMWPTSPGNAIQPPCGSGASVAMPSPVPGPSTIFTAGFCGNSPPIWTTSSPSRCGSARASASKSLSSRKALASAALRRDSRVKLQLRLVRCTTSPSTGPATAIAAPASPETPLAFT